MGFSAPGQKALIGHSDDNNQTMRVDFLKHHGSMGKPLNSGKHALISVAFGNKNATEATDESANLQACPCFRGVLKSPLRRSNVGLQNVRLWTCDTGLDLLCNVGIT